MLTLKDAIKKALSCFLLVILIITTSACSNSSDNEAEKRIPVKVMSVSKGTIENITQFTGVVKPKNLAYVVAAIPGKVTSAFFEVGDRVKKGDLLFTVDSTEIEDNILALEKQLKAAEATISIARNGVVAAMGSQYESKKLELEAKLKSAEDNYTTAKEAFDSAAFLLETGKINRLQYNQIKNQYEQAENALEAAINAYELYKTKISADARNAAEDQLKQAQASYDMIKQQLESARKKLAYTKVTSPIDGIIVTKDITEGCMVSNTMIPYSIMDADTIQVQISVTEQVINKIKKGDELDVIIPSIQDAPFKGIVSTVSPAVNEKTLTYSVLVDIPNKGNIIKPGMTAKVGILTERHDNSIVVPLYSVLKDENGSYVYTVFENHAVKKPVETGITDGEQVEILNGININELLVIEGQHFLSQNDPVIIVEEAE